MATIATIEMNYSKAIAQARKLESLSSDLEKAGKELSGSMDSLGKGWQSDAATSYRSKGVQLAEKIENNAGQLRATAEAIRTIARRVREAELENLRIAQERSY